MNRRGFLGAILAAGAAPAIVKASSIMPIWVPRQIPQLISGYSMLVGPDGYISGFGVREMPRYSEAQKARSLRKAMMFSILYSGRSTAAEIAAAADFVNGTRGPSLKDRFVFEGSHAANRT